MIQSISKKHHLFFFATGILFLLSGFCFLQQKVDKISLDLISKTLHKGQSITVKSRVYYKTAGAQMVTHFDYPQKKVAITNGNGEYKEYDYRANTVILLEGFDLSSKTSLFYNFLSGSLNDMGLVSNGFKLTKTRVENKLVISEWSPIDRTNQKISKAEIVHQNYLPVFMAFFDLNHRPIQKSFYSNYQQVGQIQMPFTITEFEYTGPGDSLITKRVYSNLKINGEVDESLLKFEIPANAKIIQPGKDGIKKN